MSPWPHMLWVLIWSALSSCGEITKNSQDTPLPRAMSYIVCIGNNSINLKNQDIEAWTNSADPDLMPQTTMSNQCLHCLPLLTSSNYITSMISSYCIPLFMENMVYLLHFYTMIQFAFWPEIRQNGICILCLVSLETFIWWTTIDRLRKIILPYLPEVLGQTYLSKQCKPRPDVAEHGIWSGSTLFATYPAVLQTYKKVVKWKCSKFIINR